MPPVPAPFAPGEDIEQIEPVASPPVAPRSMPNVAVPPPTSVPQGTETFRATTPPRVAQQPASPPPAAGTNTGVPAATTATASPQLSARASAQPLTHAQPRPQAQPSAQAQPPAQAERRRRSPLVVAAAFTLGGLVGAGGFGLGQYFAEDGSAVNNPVVNVAAPSVDSGSTEAPGAPSGSAVPIPNATPAPLGAEPAADVARIIGPSVVQVETNRGQGSGVVYADGLVLTNHHVIDSAERVQIRTSDGRVFETDVLGSDPRNDIAVLSAPGSDLPVASIGSSSALEPGQLTVAIGSPFQLQQTVTAGIVSSVNRPVPNASGGVSAMIQTDAPINPGNSGGALANRNGELVGINASIRTDGTGNSNVGIGFAVPIDTAIRVAERIVDGESLQPAVLGVSGERQDDAVGVPIAEVTAGSGAEAAGIEAGDRILTIDGAPVTNIGELTGLVQSNFTGDTVELEIQRGTSILTLEATLS